MLLLWLGLIGCFLLVMVFFGLMILAFKDVELFIGGVLLIFVVAFCGLASLIAMTLGKGEALTDMGLRQLVVGRTYEVVGSIPSGTTGFYVVVRDGDKQEFVYQLKKVPPTVFNKNEAGEYIPYER